MELYYNEINEILERNKIIREIKEKIIAHKSFENIKKNIFIYGENGIGKTFLVKNIIKELNYDILYYNNINSRNKTDITTGFNGNQNVIQLFHKIQKKIIIVIDDVDHMSSGDKNGISTLTKVVRLKKTKKQQTEESSANQIICIGTSMQDKKMKELANSCIQFKLNPPTKMQMLKIIKLLMPDKKEYHEDILNYIDLNIWKLESLFNIYNKNKSIINLEFLNITRNNYSSNENKIFTKNIINMSNENYSLNDLDKNVIGLIWHENIIDVFSKIPLNKRIEIYIYFLQNICFADYIDKFIFQKQIWQLNDLTFLIKVVKNMNFYKSYIQLNPSFKYHLSESRFTKVLTKYSTEYNNYVFLKDLCQNMLIDKNDLFYYFLENKSNDLSKLEQYEVTTLNINRMFKFLDKLLTGEDIQ